MQVRKQQVVVCGRLTNVPLQIKAHILFLGNCEYVIRKKNKNFADVIKEKKKKKELAMEQQTGSK